MKNYFLVIFFLSLILFAQQDIPLLKNYVNDFTSTLTEEQKLYLEKSLKIYEDTTSNQIVVLIISSLEGEDLFDYSIRVAEKNKIGRKGKDNGILILIVKDERKVRIEVGYGFEEVVPDAVASSIIRNIMIPYFKAGNFFEGLRKGISTIQDAIAGLYQAEKKDEIEFSPMLLFILFMLAIIFLSTIQRMRRGTFTGWTYYGGGWHSIPRRSSWGGLGSFGGFGGFGGGGFSGGGGSFGGGGASGRW